MRLRGLLAVVVITAGFATDALAQNDAPNRYRTFADWAKLPDGRTWGATSAVDAARDGSGNIWVAERCGENSCLGKDDVDTVLLFDPSGKLVRSFGAGIFEWPHGIHVDADDNVWVTDARGSNGRGHQIIKFSPEGKELMRLGKAGVAGDGPGEFLDPHALAMDSQGRLFVGDRKNNPVQIFDQDGNHIASWTQFGRPSGLYIDDNDILYSADSESNFSANAGWKRGIRIGSAKDGMVFAFIPDPEWTGDVRGTTAAEGVAVDADGNIYGAEVGPRALRKHVKR